MVFKPLGRAHYHKGGFCAYVRSSIDALKHNVHGDLARTSFGGLNFCHNDVVRVDFDEVDVEWL